MRRRTPPPPHVFSGYVPRPTPYPTPQLATTPQSRRSVTASAPRPLPPAPAPPPTSSPSSTAPNTPSPDDIEASPERGFENQYPHLVVGDPNRSLTLRQRRRTPTDFWLEHYEDQVQAEACAIGLNLAMQKSRTTVKPRDLHSFRALLQLAGARPLLIQTVLGPIEQDDHPADKYDTIKSMIDRLKFSPQFYYDSDKI